MKKIIKKHKIEKKYAEVLTKNIDLGEFFEAVAEKANPLMASSWITGELLRVLNYSKKEIDEVSINPQHFSELLEMVEKKIITELKAKEILNRFVPESFSPKKELKFSAKISDEEINKIAKKVIDNNPKAVNDFKSGKKESLNFLIGMVMKNSGKRADSATARDALEKLLSKL